MFELLELMKIREDAILASHTSWVVFFSIWCTWSRRKVVVFSRKLQKLHWNFVLINIQLLHLRLEHISLNGTSLKIASVFQWLELTYIKHSTFFRLIIPNLNSDKEAKNFFYLYYTSVLCQTQLEMYLTVLQVNIANSWTEIWRWSWCCFIRTWLSHSHQLVSGS